MDIPSANTMEKVEGCVATDNFMEVYLWTLESRGTKGNEHRASVLFLVDPDMVPIAKKEYDTSGTRQTQTVGGDSR